MLLGPVFRYELITLSRRKRYYVLRLLYGLLLLWIVWASYPTDPLGYQLTQDGLLTTQAAAAVGYWIFSSIALAQAAAVCLLTPALVAGVISDERQRKTLDYLLGSCLSSGEIVLGKLASRLMSAAVYLSLTLPVLTIVSFLGGVDPNEVLLLYAASASTMFLVASFAMFVSVHGRRPREAVTSVYIIEVAWLLGPTVVKHFLPWSGRGGDVYQLIQRVNDWVGASSPLFVLVDSGTLLSGRPGRWLELVLQMVVIQLLVGALFTTLAVLRVRPHHRADAGLVGRFSFAGLKRRRRFLRLPECGDDPVLWKEIYVARRGAFAKAVSVLTWVVVAALTGYWTSVVAGPVLQEIRQKGYWASVTDNVHQDLNVLVRGFATLLLVFWQIGAAAVASGAMSTEREEDTWLSLIATPLSPLEIVRAKLLGVLWATRWVGLLWLSLVTTGLVLGSVHPLGFVAGLAVASVDVAFVSALGLFYSFRARSTTRALTATIATLFVCNGLYLVVFIPFEFNTTFPLLGVTPFVGAVSLVSYSDLDRLRQDAMPGDAAWASVDMLFTGVVSVAVYGLFAWLLLYSLVTDFDDVIDRPRISGERPRRRRTLPRGVPVAALARQSGPDKDSSGVVLEVPTSLDSDA